MQPRLSLIGKAPLGDQIVDLDDDELMVLVCAGQKAAFSALVARYYALVVGFAARFLGDRAQAEDVAQETFVTLWQERRNYVGRGRLRAFVIGIAYNRCRSAARCALRLRIDENDLSQTVDPSAGALSALIESERQARLERAIAALPEGTRAIIALRVGAELSYREIARITGIRQGTLKARVCRGLQQLSHTLGCEETP